MHGLKCIFLVQDGRDLILRLEILSGTDHIPVAVARLAQSVPPIAGAYTGSADSKLDVGVWVSRC